MKASLYPMSATPVAICLALVSVLAGCVSPGEGAAPSVRLVDSGRAVGAVWLAADAAPEEREAAEFLTDWGRRVTGVTLPLRCSTGAAGELGIHVGRTATALRSGWTPPVTRSGESAVMGEAEPGVYVLLGESPLGARLAAAELVRESLGVEFLTPGLAGADWAPRPGWAPAAVRREWRPRVAWRAITHGGTPAENEWALNNGLGRLPAMNHAIHTVFDADAWRVNPAFFPQVDGTRIAPAGRGGYEPQPNLAHHDAAAYAATRVAAGFAQNPTAPAFSLCINDTMTWDESEESRAAFGPERWFRGRRNRTDYVFRFMNGVADRLAEGPWRDKLLTAYAYFECEAPPSFPLRRAVFPILTADRSEWRDRRFEAEDRALMSAWAGAGCATFGVYDYYYGREMTMPRFFYREQAESVKHAVDLGASLFFAEMNPVWGMDGAKAWLTARTVASAPASPDALLDLYFNRAYGAAAPAMRRFHALVAKRWADRPESPRWIRFFREESCADLFPAPVRRELTALMDEARACVAQPRDARERRMRHRVLEAALAWRRQEAAADWHEAKRALAALPVAVSPADSARLAQALVACREAERVYREALRAAQSPPWNPGEPVSPEYYFISDVTALAAWKADGLPVAGLPTELVRLLAREPDAAVEEPVQESFEADAFAASGAAGRGAAALARPWVSQFVPGQSGRFGLADRPGLVGPGSLGISGCEQAAAARRIAVSPGDWMGAKVSYAGRITPGAHVAITLRFVDSQGRKVGEFRRCVAYSGGDEAWRVLAVAGCAPAEAVAAEVGLRVSAQDATESVRFDDLIVRRLPAH